MSGRQICEICGKNEAKSICLRCRKLICSECMSQYGLCVECYKTKKILENDRMRLVDYIHKMYKICLEKAEHEDCKKCVVLREMILSLYKMIRDLTYEATKEYYLGMLRKCQELEPSLRSLLIRLIVIQGGLKLIEELAEEKEITYA